MYRGLIFCLLLVGCEAGRLSEEASRAVPVMMGMERAEILSCMGAPLAQARIGAVESWEYHTASGGHECNASVEFTDGIVTNVRYRGNAGKLLTPQVLCGQLVDGCV